VRPSAHLRAGRALAVVAVLGAGPAAAHSVLLETSPARGGTVPTAPTAVALTFNEMPQGEFSTIHVTGPDGQRRDNGHVQVVNDVVTEPLAGTRPAGRYVVDWRVVSADGHPVSGEFTFTAQNSQQLVSEPSPSPSVLIGQGGKAQSNSPMNTGTIIGIVAGVVVFGGLSFYLLRRKPAGHDPTVHE
jgi:methionine-rich copper-binding protein CopC